VLWYKWLQIDELEAKLQVKQAEPEQPYLSPARVAAQQLNQTQAQRLRSLSVQRMILQRPGKRKYKALMNNLVVDPSFAKGNWSIQWRE
jgi:hypothetical protein